MTKEAVFLETSMQVRRRFHERELKREANAIVKDFKFSLSSSYVRMEFFHSIIYDLVYLYSVVSRLDNFGDIYYRLEKLSYYKKRKLQRAMEALGSFHYDIGINTSDLLEKLQSWLRQTIDEAWDLFNESVDHILDETGCAKALSSPQKNGDAYLLFGGCDISKKKCKIDEFLVNNKEKFEKIINKLEGLKPEEQDDELSKSVKILKKALKYPNNMLKSKHCWKCGDAIISVECPVKSVLATLNKKHYMHTLSAIDKEMLAIESRPKEPELIES
jgi:hypothetical protein